jgi:hypothetical protein
MVLGSMCFNTNRARWGEKSGFSSSKGLFGFFFILARRLLSRVRVAKLNLQEETPMLHKSLKRMGDLKWGCAAWLLGLPLPFVILAFLFGGCD